jgi:hypothetical protein
MRTHNGNQNDSPPSSGRLLISSPAASPEEAAAVVAALERFMRATAPPRAAPVQHSDPWQRAAILEGVERESRGDV